MPESTGRPVAPWEFPGSAFKRKPSGGWWCWLVMLFDRKRGWEGRDSQSRTEPLLASVIKHPNRFMMRFSSKRNFKKFFRSLCTLSFFSMFFFFFFLILGNFHTTEKPTFTNLDIIYQVKLSIRAKMTANCYQQINQWKEFGNSGQKFSFTILTSKKKKKIAFLPDTGMGICRRSQQEWNQNRKLPCLSTR